MILFYAVYIGMGQEFTKQTVNVLLLGTAVTISVSWFWPAMRAFRRGASDDVSKIVLTIWLSWTALIVQRVYTIVSDALGRPDWLIQSPAALVVAVLILIAGGYAVVAPASGEDVPKREKVWSIFATTVGGIVMGAVGMAIFYKNLIGL